MDYAGRKGMIENRKRSLCSANDQPDAVIGRQRIHQECEIVNQRIIHSVSRADRGLSVSKDVPGEANSGLNRRVALFCVNTELPTIGAVTSTPLRVDNVIRGPSVGFIPARGEFLAQAGLAA